MGWVTKSQQPEGVPLNGLSTPADVSNLAYLVFFILGTAVLFPWNALISAVDYFAYLYPDSHIDRVFAVAYMFPCLIMLCYLTSRGQQYSSLLRINVGLLLYIFALVLVPVMDALLITNEGGNTFTCFTTVAAVSVTGIADALVQGSVIGEAGELPERYMQAFVAGTATCAVLVSLLRVVTKAAFPATVSGLRASSMVYFVASGGFVIFCIVTYNLAQRLPILIYYRDVKIAAIADSGLEAADASKDGIEAVRKSTSTVYFGLNNETTFYVLRKIRWLAAAMTVMYVVTLSIFPGFLAEDVHSAPLGDWYPVVLMGAYNVFDLVGKTLTAIYLVDSNTAIVGGAFSRLIFFPLYYVILHGPELFHTEIPVTVLTSLLGLTNGYYSSCLFIVAPKTVPFVVAETAGVVMTIALVVGLAIGSVVSFFWII